MQKPLFKKLPLIVGILVVTLVAFIVGGIAMSSAYATSTNAQNKSTTSAKCDPKNPKCKDTSPAQVKGLVTINAVSGHMLQATYVEPSGKKGSAVTIITTASTSYEPDPSIVAVGKTVFVNGTVNNDASITAQTLAFYDPTIGDFGGIVSKIDGFTITMQAKDLTQIVHMTDATTFLKRSATTKETQPASKSDVKAGTMIDAQGKLNSDGSLTANTVIIVQA